MHSYHGRSHGRADVFFGSTANNCREKSAEVIVDEDTSLKRSKRNQEVSQSIEGLNFNCVLKMNVTK